MIILVAMSGYWWLATALDLNPNQVCLSYLEVAPMSSFIIDWPWVLVLQQVTSTMPNTNWRSSSKIWTIRRYKIYLLRLKLAQGRKHTTTVLVVDGCSLLSLVLFLRSKEEGCALMTTITTTTTPTCPATMQSVFGSDCNGCSLLALGLFCL